MPESAHTVQSDRFGKVAVLMGGHSAEREISLKSGAAVLAALHRCGIDAHGIDVSSDVLTQIERGGFDRAFVILHGRGGEDGTIQGALEVLGVPYTGSGVLGSALGMDKLRCKDLWRGTGIPVPPAVALREAADLGRVDDEIGFPVMVKPVREGSSLGMTRVDCAADLESAWREATRFDRDVIAERWIDGDEYTASILDGCALPLIRLETPRGFYDYTAKYEADTTRYICPSGLGPERESDLQTLALRAFQAVGAGGWGRVDFILDAEHRPWLFEINTLPGMTDHSLVPMAARQAGIEFDELIVRILATSMDNATQ